MATLYYQDQSYRLGPERTTFETLSLVSESQPYRLVADPTSIVTVNFGNTSTITAGSYVQTLLHYPKNQIPADVDIDLLNTFNKQIVGSNELSSRVSASITVIPIIDINVYNIWCSQLIHGTTRRDCGIITNYYEDNQCQNTRLSHWTITTSTLLLILVIVTIVVVVVLIT